MHAALFLPSFEECISFFQCTCFCIPIFAKPQAALPFPPLPSLFGGEREPTDRSNTSSKTRCKCWIGAYWLEAAKGPGKGPSGGDPLSRRKRHMRWHSMISLRFSPRNLCAWFCARLSGGFSPNLQVDGTLRVCELAVLPTRRHGHPLALEADQGGSEELHASSGALS